MFIILKRTLHHHSPRLKLNDIQLVGYSPNFSLLSTFKVLFCGEPHLCGQLPKQHTSKPVYFSYDVVGNTVLCEPNMYP
jgi:hypothetical protein